jgi:GT2 family glycosyltransferase
VTNYLFDIIIPTWNNADFLNPCVQSIWNIDVLRDSKARLIIVNNGLQDMTDISRLSNTIIVGNGKNHGWEGGIKLGLEFSDAPFVCFQNDDVHIPQACGNFYSNLLAPFVDDEVAAVGPITTTASGPQSIFNPISPRRIAQVKWLIFFCVMLRRSHLEEVGGIDDMLPGGDDFDLCIRFNKAKKKILIQPGSFLIHHGFKTGTRVHGDHTKEGGWNNIEFVDKVNWGLINKHGFKEFAQNRDMVPVS